MRLIRLRFTLARMMTAVAILALALGARDVKLRRDRFAAMANDWTRTELVARLYVIEAEMDSEDAWMRPAPEQGGSAARTEELARRVLGNCTLTFDLDHRRGKPNTPPC